MKSATRYAIIVGVVVLLLIIVGLVLAAIFNVLLEVLYIFLMVLAALLVAATLFQIYSIVKLVQTVNLARQEMGPLLDSVNETVGIVKDTARTASHAVSSISATTQLTSQVALGPSVRAVAALVAGSQMVRIFLGKGQIASRSQQRRRQQMAAGAREE